MNAPDDNGRRPRRSGPTGRGQQPRGARRDRSTDQGSERRPDQRSERRSDQRSDRRPDRRPDQRTGGRDRRADGAPRQTPAGGRRERAERVERVERPGVGAREGEPELPDDLDLRALPRPIRAELRGLPQALADQVGAHLLMAGQLLDLDPDAAYAHADAAKRRAARLPVTREALAESAYAAGRFDVALTEMRALRRMTGTVEWLPAMADCERALGRPQTALKLARESAGEPLDPDARAEMVMVEAGARADLGQAAEARRLLKQALQQPAPGADARTRARLQFAYSELLAADHDADADKWRARALAVAPELAGTGGQAVGGEAGASGVDDADHAADEPDDEPDDEGFELELADDDTGPSRSRGGPR